MNSLMLEELTYEKKIFSPEELDILDTSRVPVHVAIMMDGNRRWAKRKGLPSIMGHWSGADALTKIVRAASELGVKVLTVYSFSTENWNRSADEVAALMLIIKTYLKRQTDPMVREGVKLNTIGDLSRFPLDVQAVIEETKQATMDGNRIELVMALNYGARDEIRRAALGLLNDYSLGKVTKEELTEKKFAGYLDTAEWTDPELLIRTSGEQRLSNFLLWQISYSEVYITSVLWPDFNERDLLYSIIDYQQRERRLGGS